MSDIFREVDEDLRQERYQKLWRRYGPAVIAAAVAVVLATAGTVGWQRYQASERAAQGDRYLAALKDADAGKAEAAGATLDALAADGNEGFRLLSRLQSARLAADSGDLDGALAQYDSISGDADVPPLYQDLAAVTASLLRINAGRLDGVEARLRPIAEGGGPWRFVARELRVAQALADGDRGAALTLARALADEQEATPALRQRAGQIVQALGG